ncbi:MAG: hypothetical protein ACFFDN_03810 [Candidatus Hodarchaeota archaeon]
MLLSIHEYICFWLEQKDSETNLESQRIATSCLKEIYDTLKSNSDSRMELIGEIEVGFDPNELNTKEPAFNWVIKELKNIKEVYGNFDLEVEISEDCNHEMNDQGLIHAFHWKASKNSIDKEITNVNNYLEVLVGPDVVLFHTCYTYFENDRNNGFTLSLSSMLKKTIPHKFIEYSIINQTYIQVSFPIHPSQPITNCDEQLSFIIQDKVQFGKDISFLRDRDGDKFHYELKYNRIISSNKRIDNVEVASWYYDTTVSLDQLIMQHNDIRYFLDHLCFMNLRYNKVLEEYKDLNNRFLQEINNELIIFSAEMEELLDRVKRNPWYSIYDDEFSRIIEIKNKIFATKTELHNKKNTSLVNKEGYEANLFEYFSENDYFYFENLRNLKRIVLNIDTYILNYVESSNLVLSRIERIFNIESKNYSISKNLICSQTDQKNSFVVYESIVGYSKPIDNSDGIYLQLGKKTLNKNALSSNDGFTIKRINFPLYISHENLSILKNYYIESLLELPFTSLTDLLDSLLCPSNVLYIKRENKNEYDEITFKYLLLSDNEEIELKNTFEAIGAEKNKNIEGNIKKRFCYHIKSSYSFFSTSKHNYCSISLAALICLFEAILELFKEEKIRFITFSEINENYRKDFLILTAMLYILSDRNKEAKNTLYETIRVANELPESDNFIFNIARVLYVYELWEIKSIESQEESNSKDHLIEKLRTNSVIKLLIKRFDIVKAISLSNFNTKDADPDKIPDESRWKSYFIAIMGLISTSSLFFCYFYNKDWNIYWISSVWLLILFSFPISIAILVGNISKYKILLPELIYPQMISILLIFLLSFSFGEEVTKSINVYIYPRYIIYPILLIMLTTYWYLVTAMKNICRYRKHYHYFTIWGLFILESIFISGITNLKFHPVLKDSINLFNTGLFISPLYHLSTAILSVFSGVIIYFYKHWERKAVKNN